MRVVVREFRIQLGGSIESGTKAGLSDIRIRRIENDPKQRPHVRFARFEALQAGFIGGNGGESDRKSDHC